MLDIQQTIDSLPPEGGEILIPSGDYTAQGIINLRSDVWLKGCGPFTLLQGVKATATTGRVERVRIEDLAIANYTTGYIGIDFRNCTESIVRNVRANGFQTGIFLTGESYYNHFEHVFADGSVDGLELYNGANQNSFFGCKFAGPKCVQIINCNGNSFHGGSFEDPNAVQFVSVSGEFIGTSAYGTRCESATRGPFWLDGPITASVT